MFQGYDVFSVKEFGGVREASPDIFLTDVRIVLQDLLGRPAGGEQVDDELDCEASAFDYRLADKDIGVDGDALLPMHPLKISV